MTIQNMTCTAAALGILLTASAVAQTRFCIGGDLDHLSAPERKACSAKMQAVKAVTSTLHAPDNWHFVVVCGEEGWKQYVAYTAENTSALLEASANTDLEQRETFLRADRLNIDQLRSLQRVVAHEVAGIVLNSKDEVAISRQMNVWGEINPMNAGL